MAAACCAECCLLLLAAVCFVVLLRLTGAEASAGPPGGGGGGGWRGREGGALCGRAPSRRKPRPHGPSIQSKAPCRQALVLSSGAMPLEQEQPEDKMKRLGSALNLVRGRPEASARPREPRTKYNTRPWR